jgi:Rad3-related DNA helicase
MSDASVSAALRSTAKLVLVEAPAGCGKTYQGASYARDIADSLGSGRLLILTHTHAACSVFHSRTLGVGSRVEIRTIDSLVSDLTDAYHLNYSQDSALAATGTACF